MKTLHFETVIDAGRETVWQTMLAPDTFRLWTAEFAPGSYFEGSWEEGARIRFLTPQGEGMSSEIAENRPGEFLSIRHLGIVKDGEEDLESEAARKWTPAYENYTLAESGSSTRLGIDVEVMPDFEQYMVNTWPKALAKLKAICEERAAGSR